VNRSAMVVEATRKTLISTHAGDDALQPQWACGQHTRGDKCQECKERDRERRLHRVAIDASPVQTVPPVVHKVLRSPGQPLDPEIRSEMELRLGHDFSRVRVHMDERAVKSARAVNAAAYTVGHNIVFNQSQYSPATAPGRRLLAHELAHVIQQAGQTIPPAGSLLVGARESNAELAARRASEAINGSRTVAPQLYVGLPLRLARNGDESSTSRQPGSRLSGDRVRQSLPGGVPIRGGTLSWELQYKGEVGSISSSGTQVQITRAIDVEMHVTFRPGPGAGRCPTITFIQTVRATTGGMQDTPHLLFTQERSGFSADVSPTETEPYYGLGSLPSGGGAGLTPDMSNTAASAAPGRAQEATFADAPIRGASMIPPGQTVVREFEVAVICVETGATFGSVRWGYTKTSDGTITLTGAQISDVTAQSASPAVEAARQAFYAGFFQYSLPDFGRGSSALRAEHRTALRQIASQPTARRIVLVGGNDFSGGPEADAALSLRRAEAAQEYLVQLGVDRQRIRVEGHGVTAREPNPPGRPVAANRRVDVHIERGEEQLAPQAQGTAGEGFRLRRQNPRQTYTELVDLLLDLQRRRGPIPESACYQFTHLVDALNRWRHVDPTVPDVQASYGNVIRRLRLRCESRIPRQRPEFEPTPLQPPDFLRRIEEPNP
jgi:outer membrane protein OmpA-like peptidoglycan-associated protein